MDCQRDPLKSRLSPNDNQRLAHQQHLLTSTYDETRFFKSITFKFFASEFMGTFILVYLSQAALTSFELTGTQNDTINRQAATMLTSSLAYLLATSLTLNLSGAHLNPAYTAASASFGYISWPRAFNYIFAQYLGAFFAAIFLHATYNEKLSQRHSEGLLTGMNVSLRAHGNILSTGKFFSSYPPTEVSLIQLSISYTLATAHLALMVLAIHESKILRVPKCIRPLYLACALLLIIGAFSSNGGPVLNPAQDFSPRLYLSLFGWGSAAFNLFHFKYWWLCALIAPHLGALIGFTIYQILAHLSNIQEPNRRRHPEREFRHDRENDFYA